MVIRLDFGDRDETSCRQPIRIAIDPIGSAQEEDSS